MIANGHAVSPFLASRHQQNANFAYPDTKNPSSCKSLPGFRRWI